MTSVADIPDYYRGKTILITGATGFLGQALVEKLLRSCPDLQQIIVIIRENKHGNLSERFDKFLNLEVFKTLRKERPNFAEKLKPIKGNLSEPWLGLTRECYKELTQTVSIVINSAAMLKLDPPLRDAILGNVLPMSHVVKFVDDCDALDVFIHMSSFFANMDLDRIGENIYPANYSAEELIEMCSAMDTDMLQSKRIDIVKDIPYTYTFTKKVTESMAANLSSSSLPVVVVRPAFVTPALHEPYPGWSQGLSGYNGIIKYTYSGIVRYICGSNNCTVEMVPVDLVVNAVIASAWSAVSPQHYCNPKDGPLVINLVSSPVNKLLMEQFVTHINNAFAEFGYPSRYIQLVENRALLILSCLGYGLTEDIKSLLTWSNATSKLKKQPFIIYMTKLFYYAIYLNVDAEFQNSDAIETSLSATDSKVFPMDMRKIDWRQYLWECCSEIVRKRKM